MALAGPALPVPHRLKQFFLPFSISPLLTRNHKLKQEIERKAEIERGENEKPLTVGPPAYFLLLNRFWLSRCRKYSPFHLLPTQLIRPEDPHRPSNLQ